MKVDEQEDGWLRAAFAAPPAEAEPAPEAAGCPAPETLWEAVHGRLPAAALREVVEHVAICAACAEEWRLAMALEEQPEESRQPQRQPSAVPRVPRRWAIGLAAVLFAVGVGVPLLYHGSAPGPVERGPAASGAIESLVADSAALPRQQFRLRWRPVPAALSYDLEVRRHADAQPLFRREGLSAPEAQVPTASLAGLAGAELVDWQVTANLPGGRQSASRTFINAVR